jgi:hypothetical protein
VRRHAVVSGGALPGKTRKCAQGLGFERGLHWEQEGDARDATTGLRRSVCNRGRHTTAVCGTAATTRSRGHEKAGKKEKGRPASILTTT